MSKFQSTSLFIKQSNVLFLTLFKVKNAFRVILCIAHISSGQCSVQWLYTSCCPHLRETRNEQKSLLKHERVKDSIDLSVKLIAFNMTLNKSYF